MPHGGHGNEGSRIEAAQRTRSEASMNELMSPAAIVERKRIQDALRRIAMRYQNGGCVVEEVAIRRAIEELFDYQITEERS